MDLPDGRSWSAEQLELMRKVAVRAVLELGKTRREMAELLGIHETTIGEWCIEYKESGDETFAVSAQGRPVGDGRLLTPDQEQQIRELVVNSTPEDHEIPSSRWTRRTVGEFIHAKLGIELSEQSVGNYLNRWRLTPQKPARHAREADADEISEFVENTLPNALKKADDEDADLLFCDEAGFRIGDQIGTTHAPRGETPVLTLPKIRIAQNMIASVTPTGELTYELYSGTMNAERFIAWLERLISEASRKILLFVDSLTSHTAHAVTDWQVAHRDELEIVWLPRYSPEYNPSEFLNNDIKQNLKNAPLPGDTSDFRANLENILETISKIPDRIKGFFQQSRIAKLFK